MVLVQKELKNAYIGEYQEWWQPWANTIAYFPFKDNQNDAMGIYSLNTSLTKASIGYSFTQSGGNINISGGLQKSAKFGGIWFKVTTWTGVIGLLGCNKLGGISYWIVHYNSAYNKKIHTYTWANWDIQATSNWNASYNQWHYYAYSLVGTTLYICKDWEVSTILSSTPYDYGTDQALCNFGSGTSANIEVSEWIIEDTGWTSQEMSDYYDLTKSNYWY